MRNRLIHLATIAVLFAAVPRLAASQESPAKPAPVAAPKHYYKLNFVLRETEEGKVLNQRSFNMDISAEAPKAGGDWWSMRAGTRIPVASSKDLTFIDVGVNLDVRADEVADGLQMQITSEISSAATDSGPAGSTPAIRQVKVRSAVMAPLSKPTTVFTADDPASKHRFELEITPVRVK